MQKWASGQFQSTLHIWPLLKEVEFLGAQNAPFERPQRPDAIWCDRKFYAHHICFSTLRIFYAKMNSSGGGRFAYSQLWQSKFRLFQKQEKNIKHSQIDFNTTASQINYWICIILTDTGNPNSNTLTVCRTLGIYY